MAAIRDDLGLSMNYCWRMKLMMISDLIQGSSGLQVEDRIGDGNNNELRSYGIDKFVELVTN